MAAPVMLCTIESAMHKQRYAQTPYLTSVMLGCKSPRHSRSSYINRHIRPDLARWMVCMSVGMYIPTYWGDWGLRTSKQKSRIKLLLCWLLGNSSICATMYVDDRNHFTPLFQQLKISLPDLYLLRTLHQPKVGIYIITLHYFFNMYDT